MDRVTPLSCGDECVRVWNVLQHALVSGNFGLNNLKFYLLSVTRFSYIVLLVLLLLFSDFIVHSVQ